MENEMDIAFLQSELERLRGEIDSLRQRNAWLERMLFGSKSDRRAKDAPQPDGPTLFDAEMQQAVDASKEKAEECSAHIARRDARRMNGAPVSRKGKRLVSYSGLEEVTSVVLPDGVDEKSLSGYDVIGHDIERTIRRTEARIWVECVDRPLLRNKAERGSDSPVILQAPARHSSVTGTHAHAEFMTSVLLDKYSGHIPEYRQVQRMERDCGFRLPTSTLNDWVHACGDHLYPLYMRQREAVLKGCYVQMDEVPMNIADRKGPVRKGYVWQMLDASPSSMGTYFHYEGGSRGGDIPKGLLKEYCGTVQTDGYAGYEFLEARPGVTLLGCMAHVRRKFVDAERENPLAKYFLDYISRLYDLEADLRKRGLDAGRVRDERQKLAVPILEHLEQWMLAVQTGVTPKSLMGKALDYAYKMWPRIMRYTRDGNFHIDNNPVERGNRKPVLGRKNYLFSQNDDGAEDNAIFYTFIESCEITGTDTREWMKHVLGRQLKGMTTEELDRLLPANFKSNEKQP